MLVTYIGENNSLQTLGFRFQKDKPIEIKDKKVLDKLKTCDDFKIYEPDKPSSQQKGTTNTSSPEGGSLDADVGEGQEAE
ncbi:hypothetical protein [Brevibacillus porteri]|uniref:Uncharacterized protein n=1 Tax=Brevibacillus porteri TaxID=2126350 RepID=A0ABX5FIZ0_9BACL|nr:hypothetical protein [Brevibacillus porteri]MED1802247.1 hypothetical protein [Brevibacillus porteri]MED2130006.1 hypothetical protein [Brevibacillus porteri]MED2745750.1 hypothetical protein [Brevibacillus porteri]MED2816634.1 hypothetical protein [Brevibacillus porteri]MED2897363.1 hypothetical protein [Brevibacillus porteri]